MKLNGSQLAVKLLERQGIDLVAGIPGGANLPLYHALAEGSIRHVLVRHEQAAGFLAQGMARTTGRAAVCFATSGPGATNLLTAIADAKLDSIPVIAITGQVPGSFIGTDAFQEVDTYGLTLPITKHNFLVRRAAELPTIIPEAFRIALSGRPGPVVIDLPKDVQKETLELKEFPAPGRADPFPAPRAEELEAAARLIAAAERPLAYAGGGVIASGAAPELAAFCRKADIPAVVTLNGLGALPAGDPHFLGMLGMHGSRAVNAAVNGADLLIVLGARFDDRATGEIRSFAPQARILHIDVDRAELGKLRRPDVLMAANVKQALGALTELISVQHHADWRKEIAALRTNLPETVNGDPMHPVNLLRAVAALLPEEVILATDVGQHQMWAAQVFPVRRPRSFLSSGGLGTMGFGLPTALGAALANPECPVVLVTGDGSLLMNIQELATLAELDVNIKILLFNNGQLGLVRQQQELFYEKRYTASCFEGQPDFCAIARGFGIPAVKMEAFDGTALAAFFERPGPALLDLAVTGTENVYPMVPPGAGNMQAIYERSKA
ncbi:MAG TPA: biosynthetic-type acetolactate synthase large subunit [Spirochaetia bacterium]|nr:biosynthetic-type acetolactate synthase large subunit [Spirochaetia bacterium]